MIVAISCEDTDKTVVCSIWPDEDMPYLVTDTYTDENGRVHPKGVRERVDLITNPLAIINRTIPMAMIESSITFIIDKLRKHMATLTDIHQQEDVLFYVLETLSPGAFSDNIKKTYNDLNDKQKIKFMKECISLAPDGTLMTNNGVYVKWDSFNTDYSLRDKILEIYNGKYKDIFVPYHIFVPKKKWGRDLYIGQDYIGYQYIMMLKQSSESGFSVRSSGAISDESLPEKSNSNKIGKFWASQKPIRFGEWKYFMLTLNFLNCGDEGFESLVA